MQAPLVRAEAGNSAVAPRVVAAAVLALLLGVSSAGASAGEFGNPPGGEFPIVFNDHTVYATPDILKRDRVLAALIRDGHIYVPLRRMFEEMGAVVSASADGKTIRAVKDGAEVSVTLGDPEVMINGQPRPLDVPPMLYNGIVLVPVRVISEALGAYVQWVPDRRIVVVRYIPVPSPPPAPPPPVPTATPAPAPVTAPPVPTPVPTPVPSPTPYHFFIQAAFAAPRNYNEFSAGEWCPESYLVSGLYALKDSPLAVKLDFRQDVYVTSDQLTDVNGNHFTSFSTIDGGTALTPVFLARQSSLDARLLYQIAAPRISVGVGYIHTANNFGYPQLNGLGVGIEKLPDMRGGFNLFGSAFYYPTASGTYTIADPASINFGKSYRQQYAILKYDVGAALVFGRSPVYLYGGLSGDRYTAKQNAPIGQVHDGPYLGLGLKL